MMGFVALSAVKKLLATNEHLRSHTFKVVAPKSTEMTIKLPLSAAEAPASTFRISALRNSHC